MHDRIGTAKNADPRTARGANGKTGVLEALRIDVAEAVHRYAALVVRERKPLHLAPRPL